MTELETPALEIPAIAIDPQTAAARAMEEQAWLARKRIRHQIAENAGDEASLLGTTSDAAALAVYGLASLVAGLATAQSLAEMRAAAAPFAALSASFLARVQSGEVQLPFLAKGIATVVADIETRATAVTEVIKAARG